MDSRGREVPPSTIYGTAKIGRGMSVYPGAPVGANRGASKMAVNRKRDKNDEFTPDLQNFVIDNIKIGNQIGRGANGRILEAKWEGTVVAVKEIHSIFMNEVGDLEFQSFKKKISYVNASKVVDYAIPI